MMRILLACGHMARLTVSDWTPFAQPKATPEKVPCPVGCGLQTWVEDLPPATDE